MGLGDWGWIQSVLAGPFAGIAHSYKPPVGVGYAREKARNDPVNLKAS